MFAIFTVECTDCSKVGAVKYSGDCYMKKLEEAGQPENCDFCGSTNVKVKKIKEQR